ncbi:MAG: AAA domain-containing protein [Pseudonocardiaceae bacterium]
MREHFRCVPDIIGFSNRYYDGKIMPLREAAELGIGPAIRPVLVPGGIRSDGRDRDLNEPEARALVEQIATCCADPAYEGMTFGVVTFLGVGQPRLIERLLFERLGAEVERRKLRVGDPYQFQGDERDVIFISFVADNLNRFAAVKKNDQQRINVAASRARTQLWLFHSMDPGILHPDDVRGHLLHYAYGIGTVEAELADLEQCCDSDFERAVLRELLTRGYRVRPQHKVGRFRIDLVVEGESDRLAIECDGDRFHPMEQWDADLRRQRVLERQGWKFWRVRGSVFYRNPVAALAPLWDRLEKLGIRPRTVASAGADVPQAEVPPPPVTDPKPSVAPVSEFLPGNVGRVLLSKPINGIGAAEQAVRCVNERLVAHIDVESEVVAVPLTVAVAPSHESTSAKSDDVVIKSEVHRHAIPARLSLVKELAPAVAPAQPEVVAATPKASRSAVRDETDPKSVVVDAVLPDGYRGLAWLREHEAAGVLKALQLRCDVEVPALNGNIPSLIRYFPPGSVQARKYHACTLVVRHRSAGDRWVGWIREYEAHAVLQAVAMETDVEVRNETGKHVGLIRYYPPGSDIAKKYRSTTRLLRRLGGGRTS